MRPGASSPATHLTVLAAEQPGVGDESDPKRHSKEAIQTVALVEDRPIALRDLETFLSLLKHAAGPKLLRLAGLVALADDPDRPLVLHTGQPAIYPLRRLATWPSDDRRTRIIAITHDLDPAILQRLFISVTGPWPDGMRLRVAMAASAALVVVFAVGLAFALHSNARTTMEASSTAPWMQDRSF
jgi:hypothetical protein